MCTLPLNLSTQSPAPNKHLVRQGYDPVIKRPAGPLPEVISTEATVSCSSCTWLPAGEPARASIRKPEQCLTVPDLTKVGVQDGPHKSLAAWEVVGVWVGDAQSVEDIAELAQRQETNTQHGCQHTSHSLQAIGLRCHSLFFAETTAQQWGTCRAALTWPALMAPNANRWASCILWISWLEAEQPPVPSSQSRKARECACYTSGLLPHKHFCKDLTAPTVVWSTLEGSSLQSSSMPSSKPPMKMRLWGGCSICMIQKLVARASRAACTWHRQTWCCFSWGGANH